MVHLDHWREPGRRFFLVALSRMGTRDGCCTGTATAECEPAAAGHRGRTCHGRDGGIIGAALLLDDRGVPRLLPLCLSSGPRWSLPGGGIAPRNPVTLALATRPMVFLGLVSYSWYLWHWPILALARAYTLEDTGLARNLALAAVSLALAYASYRFVENPIRFNRPGPFRRTETTLLAGLVISIAMCVPAGALGLWARYSAINNPRYARLVAATNDRPPLRSACHQNPPFLGLAPPGKCTAGDRSRPVTIELWGDSHADHLSPLLQAFADSPPSTAVLVRSFTGCTPDAAARAGPGQTRLSLPGLQRCCVPRDCGIAR